METNYSKNHLPVSAFHSFSFAFEETFSPVESALWMQKYWTLSFVLVVVYLVAIYFGLRFMRNRQKFSLRGPLFAWNVLLTTLYVCGLSRAVPELNLTSGLYNFLCLDCPQGCTSVSAVWLLIFSVLKAPELFDTAFIVLRKQPLFFLHWYHHCTVLVFTWYLHSRMSSVGLMFALVNAVVHALMYFYYSLKALSIRVPRSISMTLTIIQLSQMVFGCCVNYYVYHAKKEGLHCSVHFTDIMAALAIYTSYFCLFAWYFYRAYFVKDEVMIKKFKGEKIE